MTKRKMEAITDSITLILNEHNNPNIVVGDNGKLFIDHLPKLFCLEVQLMDKQARILIGHEGALYQFIRVYNTAQYGHALMFEKQHSFKDDIEQITKDIEERERADKTEADALFALLQGAISVMSKKRNEDDDGIQFFMKF